MFLTFYKNYLPIVVSIFIGSLATTANDGTPGTDTTATGIDNVKFSTQAEIIEGNTAGEANDTLHLFPRLHNGTTEPFIIPFIADAGQIDFSINGRYSYEVHHCVECSYPTLIDLEISSTTGDGIIITAGDGSVATTPKGIVVEPGENYTWHLTVPADYVRVVINDHALTNDQLWVIETRVIGTDLVSVTEIHDPRYYKGDGSNNGDPDTSIPTDSNGDPNDGNTNLDGGANPGESEGEEPDILALQDFVIACDRARSRLVTVTADANNPALLDLVRHDGNNALVNVPGTTGVHVHAWDTTTIGADSVFGTTDDGAYDIVVTTTVIDGDLGEIAQKLLSDYSNTWYTESVIELDCIHQTFSPEVAIGIVLNPIDIAIEYCRIAVPVIRDYGVQTFDNISEFAPDLELISVPVVFTSVTAGSTTYTHNMLVFPGYGRRQATTMIQYKPTEIATVQIQVDPFDAIPETNEDNNHCQVVCSETTSPNGSASVDGNWIVGTDPIDLNLLTFEWEGLEDFVDIIQAPIGGELKIENGEISYVVFEDFYGEDWFVSSLPDGTVQKHSITVGRQSYELVLEAGWNLVSLPVVPVDGLSIFLNHIPGSKAWAWSDIDSGNYYEPEEITAGQGFWLFSKEPEIVTYLGETGDKAEIPTISGWHMVGTINDVDLKSNEVLKSYTDGIYVNSNKLQTGRGYWLFIEE